MHVSTHRSAPPLQVVTGAQHTSCLSPKRIQTDFVSLIRMFRKYSSSSQADSNFYKLLTEAANSRILSAYEKILVHTWDTQQPVSAEWTFSQHRQQKWRQNSTLGTPAASLKNSESCLYHRIQVTDISSHFSNNTRSATGNPRFISFIYRAQ